MWIIFNFSLVSGHYTVGFRLGIRIRCRHGYCTSKPPLSETVSFPGRSPDPVALFTVTSAAQHQIGDGGCWQICVLSDPVLIKGQSI